MKTPGIVVTHARCFGRRKKLANRIKETGIGHQIRTRRAPDRLLIDTHQAFHAMHARHDPAAAANLRRALEFLAFILECRNLAAEFVRDEFDQRLTDETRLSRTGDTGDGGEEGSGNATLRWLRLLRVIRASFSHSRAARGVRSGKNDQGLARDLEIHVLEIVLARAAHANVSCAVWCGCAHRALMPHKRPCLRNEATPAS